MSRTHYLSNRKRMFDLALSTIGLAATLPVIALLLVAIRLGSPGSPLFLQSRVGKDGRIFTCCKLRTMVSDTIDVPTHLADASRITRIGSLLRRTKLDELPQLWNILVGDMSFVGPRPCLPTQVQLIEERRERGVLSALPGITGPAQVEGVDMSDPERLARLDAEYLQSASFRTDVNLIWQTVFKRAGQGDRVIRR